MGSPGELFKLHRQWDHSQWGKWQDDPIMLYMEELKHEQEEICYGISTTKFSREESLEMWPVAQKIIVSNKKHCPWNYYIQLLEELSLYSPGLQSHRSASQSHEEILLLCPLHLSPLPPLPSEPDFDGPALLACCKAFNTHLSHLGKGIEWTCEIVWEGYIIGAWSWLYCVLLWSCGFSIY